MENLIQAVRRILENEFYDPERLTRLDWASVIATDCIEKVAQLVCQLGDQFTRLFTLAEYKEKYQSWQENHIEMGMRVFNFQGKGMPLSTANGYPIMWRVYSGSSAWEQGLRPGDILLSVNGVSMQAIDMLAYHDALYGSGEVPVILMVECGKERETKKVIIPRRPMQAPTAYGQAIGCWSYVKIDNFFPRQTAPQLQELDDFWLPGQKGRIIDLRECGGGVPNAMWASVSLLLPAGNPIEQVAERLDGQWKHWLISTGSPVKTQAIPAIGNYPGKPVALPTVVLVDQHTASAGEDAAAALATAGAYLIGEPTCGKGIGQITRALPEHEAVFVVTNTRGYTPGGKWIGNCSGQPGHGLQPDRIVHQENLVPPGEEGDTQLQAAIQWLEEQAG